MNSNREELHEKHAVATRGTVSAFAWRQKETRNTFVEMAGRVQSDF
jgi:hypothetical protein